jgi:hypothetical protein
MLFARGFILQEKKIVRERYVFAGPLPSALPPPPRQFLPHGHESLWVMVCAAMLHCTIVPAWLRGFVLCVLLWVIPFS